MKKHMILESSGAVSYQWRSQEFDLGGIRFN